MEQRPSAYQGSGPYIFVSYAHKDSNIVLPIIAGLQDRGFRVWYDAGIELGTEWPEYIAEHLVKSACVIAFISSNALQSHNCRREINFAISLRKDPLAVYLDAAELSYGMQMQLGTLQAIFYDRHPSREGFLDTLARADALRPCLGTPEENASDGKIIPAQPIQTAQARQESVQNITVLLRMAEEDNNPQAQLALGDYYEHGIGVEQNGEEAVKWYQRSAEQGVMKAQFALGMLYWAGALIPKDISAAAKWLRKAAKHSDAEAQYQYAQLVRTETLPLTDRLDDPVVWYRMAAKQGHLSAIYQVGEYYCTWGPLLNDYEEGMKWHRRAADQGHAGSMLALGDRFSWGQGVAQNYEQAIEWYKKAQNLGHPDAPDRISTIRFNLECYEMGLQILNSRRDSLLAREHFQNSCGYAMSSFQLALLTLQSNDTKADIETAYWFFDSAKRGNTDAMVGYALCLLNDVRCTFDRDSTAEEWFTKAATAGHPVARRYLSGQGEVHIHYQPNHFHLFLCLFRQAADREDSRARDFVAYCDNYDAPKKLRWWAF